MSIRALFLALPIATVALAAFGASPQAVHGVQLQNMDRSVRPGDDFNLYANGAWIKGAVIPPDLPNWGAFTMLREKASRRTADLITSLASLKAKAGSDEQKIGDFYASFMDEAVIEAKGLAPLKVELDDIATIADKTSLSRYLGQTVRADVDPLNNTNFSTENLFGLWVAPGFDDPKHYTAYLLQGGLGLPGREYYLNDNPKMSAIRAVYVSHLAKLLALAGFADATKRAEGIVALETRIARAHAGRTDSEDVLKANNVWTREDFRIKARGMDWDAFFDGASLPQEPTFTVWQRAAFPAMARLVEDIPLESWKDYLTAHLIDHYSGVLPAAFADERFAFYGTAMQGALQQQVRWKRAVAATNDALGWAVGRLYVARYFAPEEKDAVRAMVDGLVVAFGRRLDALDWMTPQTRDRAKQKLSNLYVGIAYPDKWPDYHDLRIERTDAFGNRQRAELFEYQRNIVKLGKPVDDAEWCMTPQTVNALNLPLQNALNFPAAIFDPPFFDPKADAAFNYGAMGSIIGHEISHSFDDQGSQFDADGRRANWWTPGDFAHFQDAAARLAEQFDTYKPFADLAVSGRQTLSENIADVAGLAAAFDAWRATLHGKPAPVIDGLTGEQRFFLAYAQSRQEVRREAALRQQVLTDDHAPSMYRAQTVRNIDGWYDAFDVKPDEKLYLPPDKRVRVW